MSSLTTLNISSLAAYGGTADDPREGMGQSAYEWIAEGCRSLVSLDMSNSMQLNNVALIKIGQHCKYIARLNLSKCLQIDDEGIIGFMTVFTGALTHLDLTGNINCTSASVSAIALSPPDRQKIIHPTPTAKVLQEIKLNGLAKANHITSLSFNGCSMLTDLSISQVSKLTKLELFSIRGCDQVTEVAILKIAASCKFLRDLEISNLDLVGSAAIAALVKSCPTMTSLSCDGCNIVDKEFASLVNQHLPLARAALGKCKLEPQIRPVREFNKYILTMREKDRNCFVITRFM
eukprot:gene19712-20178_t